MDRKLIIGFGIVAFLLAVSGTAAYLANIEPADFIVEESIEKVRYKGTITFTVDGRGMGTCYLDEPNMDIDDDFEQCLREHYPNKRITDATDWLGRKYQQAIVNSTTYRSFDEDWLNKTVFDIMKANNITEPIIKQ